MAQVYVVADDGRTERMERVHCVNEDLELQRLLEKNPDLLPGDQIDPDDPRRWLLIKREMAVPDPGTGFDRWNIDFLLVDQDAVPTFVECKRFTDTRARREVVGQMLEYAANGHHYWTKDLIRSLAESSAQQRSSSLEESLLSLRPNDELSVDAFFARIEENLRQGQVRIVFFMEQSPMELRSVVDFLNRQMERSEILLVEARQYSSGNKRIVVPTLFGFTEQARLAKRTVTVQTADSKKRWDQNTFFADSARRLRPDQAAAVQRVFDVAVSLGCEISWGAGKETGSFGAKDTTLAQRSVITVYSNGTLSLNFAWLHSSEKAEAVRDRLKDLVQERLGITLPADYARRYPTLAIEKWSARAEDVAGILRDLLVEFRAVAA